VSLRNQIGQRDSKVKHLEEKVRGLQYELEVLRTQREQQEAATPKEVLIPVKAQPAKKHHPAS